MDTVQCTLNLNITKKLCAILFLQKVYFYKKANNILYTIILSTRAIISLGFLLIEIEISELLQIRAFDVQTPIVFLVNPTFKTILILK